jgi:hypothetical protein
MAVVNKSRLINFITGITGVSPGNNAVLNLPTNQRYHRLIFQCAAVNYTGGTAESTTTLTGTGSGLTITPTVVNGVITAGAVVAGGTGYSSTATVTVNDATGTGAIFSVTESGGVVSAVTVVSGGTASPVSPATLLTSLKILVNGVNMRDITPANILAIAQMVGYVPQPGELPIFFTEPSQNMLLHNDMLSWDLFGQSTFQIQFGISSTVTSPGLSGIVEFDYSRNVRPVRGANGVPTGATTPFLQPVAHHQFSWPIIAGRNDINTLPFMFPIRRLWLIGGTPGNITQVEAYQDNNKVLEATTAEIAAAYAEYGFTFNLNLAQQNGVLGATAPNSTTVPNGTVASNKFDAAYISDPDQRFWKALKCANGFVLRVYSSISQTLTIVQETLPGSFAS